MEWDIPLSVCVLLSLVVLYCVIDFLVRLPRVGRYSNRYILVTGCGQGFGFAAVKRLDLLGCHVFAGCRREESLVELKETFSDRVHPILMDVSNKDSVRKAFDYVTSQLPKDTGLWGLVNNAAIVMALPMGLATLPIYETTFATNLTGAIDVTLTFLPLIKKARGRIVNVSSVIGRFTHPTFAPYCVTKYGLEAFTDGLRRSLRPFGCKAVIVEPGPVKTNMLDEDRLIKAFESVWRKAILDGQIEVPDCEKEAEKLLETEKGNIRKVLSQFIYTTLDDVMDSYEHALFAVNPRARYLIGVCGRLFVFLQLFPEWFSDWVLEIMGPKFRC